MPVHMNQTSLETKDCAQNNGGCYSKTKKGKNQSIDTKNQNRPHLNTRPSASRTPTARTSSPAPSVTISLTFALYTTCDPRSVMPVT